MGGERRDGVEQSGDHRASRHGRASRSTTSIRASSRGTDSSRSADGTSVATDHVAPQGPPGEEAARARTAGRLDGGQERRALDTLRQHHPRPGDGRVQPLARVLLLPPRRRCPTSAPAPCRGSGPSGDSSAAASRMATSRSQRAGIQLRRASRARRAPAPRGRHGRGTRPRSARRDGPAARASRRGAR